MTFKSKLMALAVTTALGGFSMGANAALTPFQTFTGNVGLSTDGFGSSSNVGVIQASVPAGSTVVAAYLYSATWGTLGTPTVTLDGSAAAFGPRVGNISAGGDLASFRADVTSLVKSKIDTGLGGIYSFNVAETGLGNNVDGEALVVVYSNPALPTATVGILDGYASVTGDSTSINFAAPLDPTAPGFFAEMRLGIGFSCCSSQRSTVTVNGTILTENAGNNDDGANLANGSLITVGGFDDAISPLNPSYAADHERYDLSGFITSGDTTITVNTINPSSDDNIFLSTFHVSGVAGINEPPKSVPEPGSLLLMGAGLLGLSLRKRKAA